MKNFKDLLVHDIEELDDAERQLLEALPKMAKAAASPQLKQTLESHVAETEIHVQRLDRVAKLLKTKLGKVTSEGMKGLIEAGEDLASRTEGNPEILDAALIGVAQKVESYEAVAYESALELAGQLGFGEAAALLQQTRAQEMTVGRKLAELGGEAEPALAKGGHFFGNAVC